MPAARRASPATEPQSDMPVIDAYQPHIRDLLSAYEPLRIRRMFGGAGVYSGEVLFAILADDAFYLRADAADRVDFERLGPGRAKVSTGCCRAMATPAWTIWQRSSGHCATGSGWTSRFTPSMRLDPIYACRTDRRGGEA
jgi:TfoX/Sxy family transcriptional regulator of competence genes